MQEPKYKIGAIIRLKERVSAYRIVGIVLEEREYRYKCDNGSWCTEDAIEGIAVPAFKKGDKVFHKTKENVFLVNDMIYDKEFHSWRYWFKDCFESTVEEFLKLYIEVEVGSIVKDYSVNGVVIQVRCDNSCIVLWSNGNVSTHSDRYVRENATGQKIEEEAVKQHLKGMFFDMTFNYVNLE